jgi:hypothetical protein
MPSVCPAPDGQKPSLQSSDWGRRLGRICVAAVSRFNARMYASMGRATTELSRDFPAALISGRRLSSSRLHLFPLFLGNVRNHQSRESSGPLRSNKISRYQIVERPRRSIVSSIETPNAVGSGERISDTFYRVVPPVFDLDRRPRAGPVGAIPAMIRDIRSCLIS